MTSKILTVVDKKLLHPPFRCQIELLLSALSN